MEKDVFPYDRLENNNHAAVNVPSTLLSNDAYREIFGSLLAH